jgi:hypothetical protein
MRAVLMTVERYAELERRAASPLRENGWRERPAA